MFIINLRNFYKRFLSFKNSLALALLLWLIQNGQSFSQSPWEHLKPEIQIALSDGNLDTAKKLWLSALNSRGQDLGKADVEVMYSKPDSSSIEPKQVENIWNLALDQFMTWELGCPEPSTETGLGLLGICYAQSIKNQPIPPEKLQAVIQMILAQQFNSLQTSDSEILPLGGIGLFISTNPDSCGFSGPLQKNILSTAKKYPDWARVYKTGLFAGGKFLITEQGPGMEKVEAWMNTYLYWAVHEWIGFYKQFGDSLCKKAYLDMTSVLQQRIPVTNFYLNARLISALALLYGETGNETLKKKMVLLLESALLPGMLKDDDEDGIVDGTQIPFDSLAPYARKPGRFFDGANASSWNTAISGNGYLQAYLALKKSGNLEEGQKWKNRAEMVLENLCWEIINFGLPPSGTGFRDLAFLILEALLYLDNPKSTLKPLLSKSANIIWNSGTLKQGGMYTLNLGQMQAWIEKSKN